MHRGVLCWRQAEHIGCCDFCISQNASQDFLQLDEVAPQQRGLRPVNEKDCVVKVQELVCYWDKVRLPQEVGTLTVTTTSKLLFCCRFTLLLFILSDAGGSDFTERVFHSEA